MKKLLLILGLCFLFSCDLLESQNQKDAETCKTCITEVTWPYGGGSGYSDTFEACGDVLKSIPKSSKYNGDWSEKGYTKRIRTTCK